MVKRILILLGIFIAVSLVILWVLSGGIGNIVNGVRSFGNPASGGFSGFRLPWQPEGLSYGPDLSEYFKGSGGSSEEERLEEEIAALEKEYADLSEEAREAREFGTPSPFRGYIRIANDATYEEDSSREYLTLFASWNNTAPVDVSGWSLQSALSGVRAYIPRGADNFVMGIVNDQTGIRLNPGASAFVVSGYSPIGTSFRENLCSGYLAEMQSFTPTLEERCPTPSEVVPLTAENLQLYGEACVDFVKTLPACETPLQSFTPELSSSCKNHLASKLSYNGCVSSYRHRSDFARDSWRIYLGASRELWRNSHDVIRLLDAEGRTVDAITY